MTRRQRETLIAIQRHFAEHGRAPTYTEIQLAIGAKSRSHIFELCHALIEQGHIAITSGLHRSIRILRPVLDGQVFVFNDQTKALEPYRPRAKGAA